MSNKGAPMPSPAPLMALSTAYWDSQVFLCANRIGVFALLSEAPLAAAEIAAKLNTGERATTLLLNACVALGLLECDDKQRFANSALSATYLVPGQPGFMGNAVAYSDNLYNTWGELEKALRDERPPMAPETYLGDDPKHTRDFVYGMHDRALGIGRAMVGLVDLKGRKALL
ncbi:MAG: methyltransferase dimerization domain-containing protein, partial [Pseudomonadota bacterium]